MRNEPLTQQEKQEQEIFQLPVSESKRTALLRYLIIMFAVAFVMVLMSMVLQVRSSNATVSQLHQSSTSAMTRAQKLQEDNRALTDRVAAMEQELAQITAALEDERVRNNALQAENKALKDGAAADGETLKTAADALAGMLMTDPKKDGEAYTRAVDAAKAMKQYLPSEVAEDFETWLEKQ